MKVTSIKPLVISSNAKEHIELYNALGFEEKHFRDTIEDTDANTTVLADENDNRIFITQTNMISNEATAIHINVDDFDEAQKLLISKGYTPYYNCPIRTTKATKSQMLISKSGTLVAICQHLK